MQESRRMKRFSLLLKMKVRLGLTYADVVKTRQGKLIRVIQLPLVDKSALIISVYVDPFDLRSRLGP
jgi:hypothetical protein